MLLMAVFMLPALTQGAQAASSKVIVINPGHSIGYDSGAVNASTGVTEAQVNEKLAGALAEKLDRAGYTVYLTHTSDSKYDKYRLGSQADGNSLRTIGELTNSKNPDLAISIHHNSGGSSATGYEIYWSSYRDYDTQGVYEVSGLWGDGSTAFRDSSPCQEAQDSLVFAQKVKDAFSGSGLGYRFTLERDDYLPAHAKAPCILYEGSYISNASESRYLISDAYANDASNRFLTAINSFFATQTPESKPVLQGWSTSFDTDQTTNAVNKITAKIDAPSEVTRVLFPVWSEQNGQDDLVWYEGTKEADGFWSVTFDIANHKNDLGKYNVHVYASTAKTKDLVGVGSKEFTISLLSGIGDGITVKKDSEDLAQVYVKDSSNPSVKYRSAVWSEKDGQDDLIWSEGIRQTDGSYKTSVYRANHNYDQGLYNVHVYRMDGTGVGTTTFEFLPYTYDGMDISTPSNGTFTITLKNVTGAKKVQVPVWSDQGGQDDIVWYDAKKSGNNYVVTVDTKDHKGDYGTYHVHVYLTEGNGMTHCVDVRTVDLPKISGNLSASLDANGKIQVKLSGVNAPNGLKKVELPVWTEKNGQDDLIWYTAAKKGNDYTIEIDPKKHKSEVGKYVINAYGTDRFGKQLGIGETAFTIEPIKISSISVSDVQDGAFTITLSGVSAPNGVKAIQIPVWTEKNGQDDLVWYTAVKDGDSYKVNVKLSEHKNESGIYNIHVYGVNNSGIQEGIATLQQGVNTVKPDVESFTAQNQNGKIQITLKLRNSADQIAKVKFPVWTEENGQDDIVWYDATKSGNTFTLTVDPAKHGGKSGTYNVHAYVVDNGGNQIFAGSQKAVISPMSANVSVSEPQNGAFTVTVSGVQAPLGVSSIRIPVWSQVNGQDDLIWYTAQKNGDSYVTEVKLSSHKNDTGTYSVHVYGVNSLGSQELIGSTTVEVASGAVVRPVRQQVTEQTSIMGDGQVTADQLVSLYKNMGGAYPSYYETRGVDLNKFAQMYVEEAVAEGVRADVAFAQAMHETGWLAFGGDVQISQFNFAGLGATGGGVTGENFAEQYGDNENGIRMGIRAQIQHLKAYASAEPLNQECVDNRYKYVSPKGKAPTIGSLTGTWAMDSSYAAKLVKIINAIE